MEGENVNNECPEHSAHVARIERSEQDIQELWKVTDIIREEIKRMAVKFAWLMGVLTAAQVVAMVLVNVVMRYQGAH